MLRTMLSIVFGLLAGFVLITGTLWAFQDRLIYIPDRSEPPPPAQLGLPEVSAIRLATEDGLSLLAWWLPPPDAAAPVVLFLHGNAGNLAHRAGRAAAFRAAGQGALLVGWRGYGGNPGRPDEAGLVRDARAALAWLGGEGIGPARIGVWGESLGTAIALHLAASRPVPVGAVVLESPFTSLVDVARVHYPLIPAGLLLRDRFDSLSRVGAVTVPMLILTGGRDRLVPPGMGQRLAEAAGAPVETWQAPLADHNDVAAAGGQRVGIDFLRRSLGER
jgi:fermentation-respiration switch protein FrsA (DUF1100 family)